MENNKKWHPTESELEILQVLWDIGPATVRQVHEVLEKTRETGYTTSLKTMQIMHDKGLLTRDTSIRSHVYAPTQSRKQTESQFVGKMIEGLYRGSAGRMVMGALSSKKISRSELEEIKKY
ncbi:MAG: BlaI/MecI/CopY family transcriptional regulator, partial [Bacteroidia bacterium]|nr:BlaI/MecI/CopY family transcriptional regulator [Bacteroidia bacterium]